MIVSRIQSFFSRPAIAITISAPNTQEGAKWGDFYFASMLQQAFKRRGIAAIVLRDGQRTIRHFTCHIHIRGLTAYSGNYLAKKRYMWIISHPDEIQQKEFAYYTGLFIASLPFAENLSTGTKVPCYYLPQCAEPRLTAFQKPIQKKYDVSFVGNTRGEFRESVRYAVKNKIPLAVWGDGWEQFIPNDYIKGTFLPYQKVPVIYASSKIVINDHWSDMKRLGFINNRLYDVLACSTYVVSDAVAGLQTMNFPGVSVYHSEAEFVSHIHYLLAHKPFREKQAQRGRDKVITSYTYDIAVEQILLKINMA